MPNGVDGHSPQASTVTTHHGELDLGARGSRKFKAPQLRCGAVAQECARGASEESSCFPRQRRLRPVTDQVHAWKTDVQRAQPNASVDLIVAEAGGQQLLACHATVLTRTKTSHHRFEISPSPAYATVKRGKSTPSPPPSEAIVRGRRLASYQR